MGKNVAVVLAGGVGNRMGMAIPKQFLMLSDRTILEHSVDAFERNSMIDNIIIVANQAYIEDTKKIVERNSWCKVACVISGGKERYDSSLAAIQAAKELDAQNIVFHDAVRPLVSQRVITESVEALNNFFAAGVAVPSVDTILHVENGVIVSVPQREKLWRAQTPQSFKLSTIIEAYSRALDDPEFKATDDCGVVMKYMPEVPVHIVKGDESNLKLTYKEDIEILELLLKRVNETTNC